MNGKIKLISPVTFLFALMCWVAYGMYVSGSPVFNRFLVYFSTPSSFSPSDPASLVCLFTHVFGWMDFNELCVNSIVILAVGQIVEQKLKSPLNMLAVILVTSLVAGLIYVFWDNSIHMSGCTCVALVIAALAAIAPDGDQYSFSLVATFLVFLLSVTMRFQNLAGTDRNVLICQLAGALAGVIIGMLLRK